MLTASVRALANSERVRLESGSNAGSDPTFAAYSDAGSFLGNHPGSSSRERQGSCHNWLPTVASGPRNQDGDFTVRRPANGRETQKFINNEGRVKGYASVTLPSASANPGREITIKTFRRRQLYQHLQM